MTAALLLRAGTGADIDALLEVERRAAALLLGHGAYDLFAIRCRRKTFAMESLMESCAWRK